MGLPGKAGPVHTGVGFSPAPTRAPADRHVLQKEVMPDGGARSATVGRMSAVSLRGVVRGHDACADHSGLVPVVDTYRLAVASPLSLLTFFAAAKKVSAAPHRGITNRPLTKQGKANPVGTPPTRRTGKKTQQNHKPKEYPPNPLLFDPSREAHLNNNSPYQH